MYMVPRDSPAHECWSLWIQKRNEKLPTEDDKIRSQESSDYDYY